MHAQGLRRLALLFALAAIAPNVRLAHGGEKPAPSAVAPALRESALPAEQRAEKAFLEHLGWRFVADPSAPKIAVVSGTPCRRTDLASAQAAGDLRILVPPAASAADVAGLGASLAGIADSVPSRCAWQFLMAPAVDRAIRKLSANEARGYWTFPTWVAWNSPLFYVDPPAKTWVREGRICRPRAKPSAAIEAFYFERANTECYVGQALTAYAIQYELYGPSWFDEVYEPGEIALGQVQFFHETPLGRWMNVSADYPWRALFLRPTDDDVENPGTVLGRLGPLAFKGLTGILMDQNGTGRSNQNFTFVSVSQEAVDALVQNGGFPLIAERTQKLLDLEKATHTAFITGAELTAIQARVDRILSHPVFTGIRLHIHPYGVIPLGEIVDHMRRRDKVALELILYTEAREDQFFQRYRQAWKSRWSRSMTRR